MGNLTEKDILEFAMDFAARVDQISFHYLENYGDHVYFMWSNKKIDLYELEEYETPETDVRERTGNENCIAFLPCEGELYEKMYYCDSMGGGGEDGEKLLDALYKLSEEYGMWFEWDDGAVIFYEDSSNKIDKDQTSNDFYEMVKEWTRSDCNTPGIKSDVILKMLLSEFIEDIISYHLGRKATLLVKGFPIRTNEDDCPDTVVDYLVYLENGKLLLVEFEGLNRLDKDKFNRIKSAAAQGAAELLKYYDDLCKPNSGNWAKYRFSRVKFDDKKIQLDKISDVDYLCISLFFGSDIERDKNIALGEDDYKLSGDFRFSFEDKNRRKLWYKVRSLLSYTYSW